MPKQDWSINTPEGYAGDQYGLATTNSQRLTYLAETKVTAYGLGVQIGSSWNHFKLGADADGNILGIMMRENKLESAVRPGDGSVLIPVGQPIGIMLEGAILVKLETALSTAEIGMNDQGQFGAIGGDFKKVNNVQAIEYPKAAGDVVPVMVRVFTPKQ